MIDADGSQLGVMDTREALGRAQEQELDLVEVDPRSRPPVCKILDYGKFKYSQSKKARDSKKSRFVQETKEIKMTPKIGDHDISFKIKHARAFIEEGHKVRLLCRFRGREIVHPETGRAVLSRVCEEIGDACVALGEPQMEQRQMSLIIGPSAKAKARAKSLQAAKEAAGEQADRAD